MISLQNFGKLAPAALAFAVLAVGYPLGAAKAQVNLTFSGGNGSPLTISLLEPITYTVTATENIQPVFVFQGLGNLTSGSFAGGTAFYSLNGGPAHPLNIAFNPTSLANFGETTINDVLLIDPMDSSVLTLGDTVTLSAGTITLDSAISFSPANGSYNTFLVNVNGERLSTNTVAAAPEPGTLALLALGTLAGGVVFRRKPIFASRHTR